MCLRPVKFDHIVIPRINSLQEPECEDDAALEALADFGDEHTRAGTRCPWHMDLRRILCENAIKEMVSEEDNKFLRAVAVNSTS